MVLGPLVDDLEAVLERLGLPLPPGHKGLDVLQVLLCIEQA